MLAKRRRSARQQAVNRAIPVVFMNAGREESIFMQDSHLSFANTETTLQLNSKCEPDVSAQIMQTTVPEKHIICYLHKKGITFSMEHVNIHLLFLSSFTALL